MSDTEKDPTQEPTTSEEDAEEEAEVLLKGWLRVALVSIISLLFIVLGLLHATDVIELFPFGTDWTVQWLVFVLIGVAILSIEFWSWKSL